MGPSSGELSDASSSTGLSLASIAKAPPVGANHRHPSRGNRPSTASKQASSAGPGFRNPASKQPVQPTYPYTRQGPIESVAQREHISVDPSYETGPQDDFYKDPWQHRVPGQ